MTSQNKTPSKGDQTDQNGKSQTAEQPVVEDIRSQVLVRGDRSEHRRHAQLYEDLLN